jgi:hippurate hydrolase
MNTIEQFDAWRDEIAGWRHHIHAHPETAFEEVDTAAFVAEKLESFGLEVHTGIGRTGVVGVLRCGDGPAVGLRADMDALHVDELTNLPYASRHPGKMHACGHDGHTTMLLAAARYLAENRPARGTVVFIFQPAEENEGGGRAMVEDGLFARFPVDAVFGMHNWPGLAVGRFALKAGPMMAACDTLEVTFRGRGGHGAMPHLCTDPMPAAAHFITAAQTIVSRNVEPTQTAVVSVTQVHGGHTWNVIPDEVRLTGTLRAFDDGVRAMLHRRLKELGEGVARSFAIEADVRIQSGYPAVMNSADETAFARDVAREVAGTDAVDEEPTPSMGAEDFSFMLKEKPGCYVWIGNGPGEGGCLLHNARYDFNDDVLGLGASYWVRLAERFVSGPG